MTSEAPLGARPGAAATASPAVPHVEPLSPAERTLAAMLRRGAERHGDRPLLSFGDATWSHRGLLRLVARGPRVFAPPAWRPATGWR
jgi:hypothetical protein